MTQQYPGQLADNSTHLRDKERVRIKEFIESVTQDTETPLSVDRWVPDQYENWFIVNWQKNRLIGNYQTAFFLAAAFTRFVYARGWYPRGTSYRTEAAIEYIEAVHGRIY